MNRISTSILYLFCCIILFCNNANAQYSELSWYLGPTASFNSNFIIHPTNYGHDAIKPINQFGFMAGIMGGINWNEFHNVQLETLFSKQGQDYRQELNSKTIRKQLHLNYIQFPLLYRFIFPLRASDGFDDNAPRFYISSGIQISKLLSASLAYTQNSEELSFKDFHRDNSLFETTPMTTKELFQSTDFGLVFGFGGQYLLGDYWMFSIELRCNLSLTDMNDPLWRYPPNDGAPYRSALHFPVGLRLALVYFK